MPLVIPSNQISKMDDSWHEMVTVSKSGHQVKSNYTSARTTTYTMTSDYNRKENVSHSKGIVKRKDRYQGDLTRW